MRSSTIGCWPGSDPAWRLSSRPPPERPSPPVGQTVWPSICRRTGPSEGTSNSYESGCRPAGSPASAAGNRPGPARATRSSGRRSSRRSRARRPARRRRAIRAARAAGRARSRPDRAPSAAPRRASARPRSPATLSLGAAEGRGREQRRGRAPGTKARAGPARLEQRRLRSTRRGRDRAGRDEAGAGSGIVPQRPHPAPPLEPGPGSAGRLAACQAPTVSAVALRSRVDAGRRTVARQREAALGGRPVGEIS